MSRIWAALRHRSADLRTDLVGSSRTRTVSDIRLNLLCFRWQAADVLVVLDAMGVIFRTRDDWPGHLTRFVAGKGGTRAAAERDPFVEKYFACTLGECSTGDLWQWCGLDPDGLDEEYLAFYVPTPGLHDFISEMRNDGHELACLTNDAAAWSRSLRKVHKLDSIDPWLVSSEVGIRKPDARIFDALQTQVRQPLHGALFVDDTESNLDAAVAVGLHTIHFRGNSDRHRNAHSWAEVAAMVADLRGGGR